MIDLRVTYGGMSVSVGILLVSFLRSEERLAEGLRAVAVILGGLATARTVGIVMDGDPNGFRWVYLMLKVLGVTIGFALLRGGGRLLTGEEA